MQNPTLKLAFYGLLSWLVPFVISFGFVDSKGQFVVPQPLFKSIMVVVFGGFGAWLLTRAFRLVAPTLASGLRIGLGWLGLNLALDLIVLVPLIGMPVGSYFMDIGLRYLLIPIMATGMVVVAERAGSGGG
jgi:hypothetical protein